MEILVILLLALINGVFAMTEIAFVSVKRPRLIELKKNGSVNAAKVLDLLHKPEKFLSTVQVAISAVAIFAGAYGGASIGDYFTNVLEQIGLSPAQAVRVSLVMVVAGIAFVTILIGELVPKTIAMRNALRISLAMVPFMLLLTKVLYPFVWVLMTSTKLLLRLMNIKPEVEDRLTEDELRLIIKTAGKQGILGRDQNMMHENLFFFSDASAHHIMTPRHEIEWINMSEDSDKAADIMRRSVHSKFPVCEGSIDRIRGIVHAQHFFHSAGQQDFSWNEILVQPIFFPKETKLKTILDTFRTKKEYFAVIVDEFGAFEGLITLHDLMEAIVGNLPSLDEDDHNISVRADGSLLVSGSCRIKTLNQHEFGRIAGEQEGSYQTVAGYLMHQLQRLPETGEIVELNGFRFEIVDLDGARIDKVIITKHT